MFAMEFSSPNIRECSGRIGNVVVLLESRGEYSRRWKAPTRVGYVPWGSAISRLFLIGPRISLCRSERGKLPSVGDEPCQLTWSPISFFRTPRVGARYIWTGPPLLSKDVTRRPNCSVVRPPFEVEPFPQVRLGGNVAVSPFLAMVEDQVKGQGLGAGVYVPIPW